MTPSLWTIGDTHPLLVRLATYVAVVLAKTTRYQVPTTVQFDFVRRVVFVRGDVMCILALSGPNLAPSIAFGYWNEFDALDPWIKGAPSQITRDIVTHLTRGAGPDDRSVY